MMGDRDYRSLIKNALDSIGTELEVKIDEKDNSTIHITEVNKCLRRSYYDRKDAKPIERSGFNELLTGLLRKLHYGTEPKEFEVDGIKLKVQADMIVDDVILIFRSATNQPKQPFASDLLYLNACMWIYDKFDGLIIYITGDRQEISFSLTRNKTMFEQVVRRVRVLNNLLKEEKTPILEPSEDCSDCQYYQRCYVKKQMGRSVSLSELVGLKKED